MSSIFVYVELVIVAILIFAIGARVRRNQRRAGLEPDALAKTVQQHVWLQWYLVIFMFILIGAIVLETLEGWDMLSKHPAPFLIGGLVFMFLPIFIANRRG